MVALVWALFVGLVIGGGTSALSVYVFGSPWGQPLAAWAAYLLAPIAGVLVGLVAGKPIWAKGARIEAGLKAAFGAALGAALMFALRRWGSFSIDLSAIGLGQGQLGTHPATALPIVTTLMALLFEVDNMFGGGEDKTGGGTTTRKRIAAGGDDSGSQEQEEPADAEEQRGGGRARR